MSVTEKRESKENSEQKPNGEVKENGSTKENIDIEFEILKDDKM